MAIKIYASGNTLTVGIDTYAPNSGLTASLSTETGYTNYVIIQDSYGRYPVTALYSDIVKQDGTTAWGANALATKNALNALFSSVNPNGYGFQTEIDEIKRAVQVDKNASGGRGLYYDDGKSTTSSKVSVGDRIASVQGGRYTGLSVTESSPGTHTFNVAAGPSGSETQFSALTLVGETTADKATFNILDGTRLQFEDKYGNLSYIDMQNVDGSRSYALPNSSGTIALTSDIGTPGISNVVEDTTPQLGGDLDTNGHNLDMTSNTASTLVITANQYAFRYKSTGGVLQNTGLYFNASTGQYEFLNGSGDCIFCIKAGTGELTIGTGASSYILPINRGTSGQVLAIDGSGNVDWSTVSASGLSSTGDVTVQLDSDNNTSGSKFKILSGSGATIFSIDEDGNTEGLLTLATPTVTLGASSYQVGATGAAIISNYSAANTYTAEIYSSTGINQNITVTNTSGLLNWTVPPIVATGWELRVYSTRAGYLKSAVSIDTFDSTASTTFSYWRLQGVNSSGTKVSSKIYADDIIFYTGSSGGGTAYPTTNLTSNTSESGITISAGYSYSSTYDPWKAFDSQTNGSGWWTLGNSTAANNWIQLEFTGGAVNIQSVFIRVSTAWTDADYIQVLGSNTGSFSGEEVLCGTFTGVSTSSDTTGITLNL